MGENMRTPVPDRKRAGGFTLIELVIASVLLAIVVTGIAFFFMHVIKISDDLDSRGRALEVCRDGIETLRSQEVVMMPDGWQATETVEGFTRRIWIDTPYSEYPEAKLVMCRVNWSGAEGADSLDLSTIM